MSIYFCVFPFFGCASHTKSMLWLCLCMCVMLLRALSNTYTHTHARTHCDTTHCCCCLCFKFNNKFNERPAASLLFAFWSFLLWHTAPLFSFLSLSLSLCVCVYLSCHCVWLDVSPLHTVFDVSPLLSGGHTQRGGNELSPRDQPKEWREKGESCWSWGHDAAFGHFGQARNFWA